MADYSCDCNPCDCEECPDTSSPYVCKCTHCLCEVCSDITKVTSECHLCTALPTNVEEPEVCQCEICQCLPCDMVTVGKLVPVKCCQSKTCTCDKGFCSVVSTPETNEKKEEELTKEPEIKKEKAAFVCHCEKECKCDKCEDPDQNKSADECNMPTCQCPKCN